MYRKVVLIFLLTQFLLIQTIIGQSNDPDRAFGNRSAAKRLALVIGNSAYQNTDALPNPKNDAVDMKAALESLGFEVIYGVDQNARQMKSLIRQFGDKLAQTKAVGLFYYAGHGIASGGENYLVPVDADIPAEDEIDDATVGLSFLMDKMTLAENDLNIVILDACRNNPFARKWRTVRDMSTEGGLATIRQAPYGTLIAYATQPGNTASDGTLRNGLYTQELLQQMKKPNLTIEDIFKNVRSEVRRKSKNAQVPWESSSIEGNFYFAGANGIQPVKNSNRVSPNGMPTLIARYPLISDGNDILKKQDSLKLYGTSFEGGGVKIIGKYVNIFNKENGVMISTEKIPFNLSNFSVRVDFKVSEKQNMPIFSIDKSCRHFNFYLTNTGKIMLKVNNSEDNKVSYTDYKTDTWHTATLTVQNGTATAYLDNLEVVQLNANTLRIEECDKNFGEYGKREISTTNFGNGEIFKGFWRDLRVYNGIWTP